LLIEKRLGGYEHTWQAAEPDAPQNVDPTKFGGKVPHVAVVGCGLAGLSAAHRLALRGVKVTVFEKDAWLGGKVGSWMETLDSGVEAPIDHGFHAFFHHYYNLNRWVVELDLRRFQVEIPIYRILTREREVLDFRADVGGAPGLNLLGLAKEGLFKISDLLKPSVMHMAEFFRYNDPKTFERHDNQSFEDFARKVGLPRNLLVVFRTFARTFFAEDDKISQAELIKSFHFFYLSHPHGLACRYIRGNYRDQFLNPIRAALEAQGVDFRLSTAVEKIEKVNDSFRVHTAEDAVEFDAVVLAPNVQAVRKIWDASPDLARNDSALSERLGKMKAGQRYAVMRIWLVGVSPEDEPVFVGTDRFQLLDSMFFLDRIDPDVASCARPLAGDEPIRVIELHSYAVPDSMKDRAEVEAAFFDELYHYYPELKDARVLQRQLQLKDDATALHKGMAEARPGTTTADPRLLLAGDWVRLPFPAMLMEAAHTSGAIAANELLQQWGLARHRVTSVPRKGLLG